jgi:hypothetical protein
MRYARATFAGATLLTAVSAVPAYADHMLLMGTEDRGWRTTSFTPESSGLEPPRLPAPEPYRPPVPEESRPSVQQPRPPAAGPDSLDIDIKIGQDSFRLGARLFGGTGVWGAWLNGQSRKDGFTLDGRLQHPDHAYNFRLNADLDAMAKKALDQLLKP